MGRASSSQPKNLSALNPGVQKIEPPTLKGASVAAISPWMWNSGITFRQRSVSVSASDRTMFAAETFAPRLIWDPLEDANG